MVASLMCGLIARFPQTVPAGSRAQPSRGLPDQPQSAKRRAMLVIDDLALRMAGKLLLDGASARIPDGARVGLVGRNGTGKTTLFRAIVGEVAPDHGNIVLSPRARMGRLAQDMPLGHESLLQTVLM